MNFFRIIIVAVIILPLVVTSTARADNSPLPKIFLPLASGHGAMPTGMSPTHFFPLAGRAAGKFVPHVTTIAAPQEEDIPKPRENLTPEKMTREQANQIISIFGGSD